MKRYEWILPVVVLGSLWGLVEVLPIPIPFMMVAGVLFLTIGRRIVNRPGTSVAMGLVVCLLKTYAINFHVCNLSGILSLAVAFDALSSFAWREDTATLGAAALRGALTVAIALPLFVGAMWLVRHPYWVAEGWPRILDYAVRDTLPAMLFALIAAPLGVLFARWWMQRNALPRFAAIALYGSAVVAAWGAATLRFIERAL